MQRGIMITLEGIDGAGKGAARDTVQAYLAERGIPFIITREPGGTPLAEELREFLLKPVSARSHDERMEIGAETAGFFTARRQHIESLIRPRLDTGWVVVSDRFTDSTYAYQGAKGISYDSIAEMDKAIVGTFRPDHTIYLDIDVETSLARHTSRGRAMDRMEEEFYANAVKTIQGYQQRINGDPDRFIVIDAKPPIDEVQAEVRKALDTIFG